MAQLFFYYYYYFPALLNEEYFMKFVNELKVSDGASAVGKCLRNILIPCFGSDCVWEWRIIPQTLRVFLVRKKYTTFSTVRIVALRSVNKIFPETYDFAATFNGSL